MSEKTNSVKNALKVFKDFILSALGLVVMNGAMQLFINPSLEKWLGKTGFGEYQSIFAIVAIMGTTFGVAANYSRVLKSREKKDSNGDYNLFMLMSACVCVAAAGVTLYIYKDFTVAGFCILSFLMIFTVLRYYGDCWFRLKLDYLGYFFYYVAVTAGYCAGLAIFRYLVKSWMIAILTGEAAAVVFVFFAGRIFRGPGLLRRSEHFSGNFRSFGILSASNAVSAVIQNADRIILRLAIDPAAVTIFYVSTLLGKVVSLLTTPLNGVMIGYLARFKGKISKKMFLIFTLASLGVGVVACAACYVGSLILIPVLYRSDPELIAEARQYYLLANAGQVFFFVTNCLTTIILRMAGEKYSMYTNLFYLAVYAAAVIPLTLSHGIWGMATGLMIANTAKFVFVAVIGFMRSGEKSIGE
ncbi:MAG: hypothetical protein K6G90_11455 [Clostridia bacterium]|nr:hypothetical protein [Clostridia bacterium]